MSIVIGDVSLRYGLMLAPMAGYTDYAMRRICRECGAEYLVSEMVSAKALVYQDRKSIPLARIRPEELPAAVQLFGAEPDVLAEAARLLEAGVAGGAKPSAIDLNFGCPVRKITANGEGSALMKSPKLIEQIVSRVSKAVKIPVTAKLRIGWDEASRNAVECALRAEAGGATAVCIHGRTRTQQYSGEADLDAIADDGGFTDDDTHTVVNYQTSANFSTGMDFNSCKVSAPLGHTACKKVHFVFIKPVCNAVVYYSVDTLIQKKNLKA